MNKNHKNSRRNFLKTAALAAPVILGAGKLLPEAEAADPAKEIYQIDPLSEKEIQQTRRIGVIG